MSIAWESAVITTETQDFSVDPLINRKIKSAVEGLQLTFFVRFVYNNPNYLGQYLKHDRLVSVNEIRRRIVERGESNQEIMHELNLPARTYFRYRQLAFQGRVQEFNELIQSSDLSEHFAILQSRVNAARVELWDLAHNDKLDPKDRDSRRECLKDSVTLATKMFIFSNRLLVVYHEDVSKGHTPVIAPQLVAQTSNAASSSTTELLDGPEEDDEEEEDDDDADNEDELETANDGSKQELGGSLSTGNHQRSVGIPTYIATSR
jgi:hypothetical protein